MKVTGYLLSALLCLLPSLPQQALAKQNLHFTGTLISSMCDLSLSGGVLDTVVFPNMAAPDLALRGQSMRVPVTLTLTNCRGTVLQNGVQVTFSGVEDPSQAGFLALDESSTAGGFSVGLETQAGAQVKINDEAGTIFMVKGGDNMLVLNAWLQTVAGQKVTPGTFTATATATFEYL